MPLGEDGPLEALGDPAERLLEPADPPVTSWPGAMTPAAVVMAARPRQRIRGSAASQDPGNRVHDSAGGEHSDDAGDLVADRGMPERSARVREEGSGTL